MKTVIFILLFSVLSFQHANAQATSSQKSAQITDVSEHVVAPVQPVTTATVVSGARKAVIREVPVENKSEATPQKSEIISAERKPQ